MVCSLPELWFPFIATYLPAPRNPLFVLCPPAVPSGHHQSTVCIYEFASVLNLKTSLFFFQKVFVFC